MVRYDLYSLIALAFNDTQRKWQTLEQEAFAVYHCITVCHHYLIGTHFYVHTDHKNLTYTLKTETPKVIDGVLDYRNIILA